MYTNALERVGLTNRNTEDLRELISQRSSDFRAYCNSDQCSRTLRGSKTIYSRNRRKYTSTGTTDCPDCGHVLVWKRYTRVRETAVLCQQRTS